MGILVYIESEDNKFKKTSYEALSYGKALADKMNVTVSGLVFNCNETDSLKKYGADKIIMGRSIIKGNIEENLSKVIDSIKK